MVCFVVAAGAFVLEITMKAKERNIGVFYKGMWFENLKNENVFKEVGFV